MKTKLPAGLREYSRLVAIDVLRLCPGMTAGMIVGVISEAMIEGFLTGLECKDNPEAWKEAMQRVTAARADELGDKDPPKTKTGKEN